MGRSWQVATVASALLAATLAGPAVADGARIEAADGDRALEAGDGGDMVIESVGEGGSSGEADDRPPGVSGTVRLRVAAAPQSGDSRLPSPEERELPLGERSTIFKDTYEIGYIDDMRSNEAGERAPVVKNVAFGRWVDVAVDEAGDDGVRLSLYFVRKQPVNVARSGEGPRLELPEANYNMVSRQVRLKRGASEQLRLRDGQGDAIGVRLTLPVR